MRVQLQADKIVETARILQARIDDRFPNSGLSKLATDLWSIAYASRKESERISRPIWGLRVIVGVLIALIAGGIIGGLWTFDLPVVGQRLEQVVSILETVINDAVLVGAAIFFLVTIETRIKRRRALQALLVLLPLEVRQRQLQRVHAGQALLRRCTVARRRHALRFRREWRGRLRRFRVGVLRLQAWRRLRRGCRGCCRRLSACRGGCRWIAWAAMSAACSSRVLFHGECSGSDESVTALPLA